MPAYLRAIGQSTIQLLLDANRVDHGHLGPPPPAAPAGAAGSRLPARDPRPGRMMAMVARTRKPAARQPLPFAFSLPGPRRSAALQSRPDDAASRWSCAGGPDSAGRMAAQDALWTDDVVRLLCACDGAFGLIIVQNSSKSMPPSPFASTSWTILRTRPLLLSSSLLSRLRTLTSSSVEMRPSPSRSNVQKAAQHNSRFVYRSLSIIAATNSVKSMRPEPLQSMPLKISSSARGDWMPWAAKPLRTSSTDSSPSPSRSMRRKSAPSRSVSLSGSCWATAVRATRFIRACRRNWSSRPTTSGAAASRHPWRPASRTQLSSITRAAVGLSDASRVIMYLTAFFASPDMDLHLGAVNSTMPLRTFLRISLSSAPPNATRPHSVRWAIAPTLQTSHLAS
mmetsp:Transcript_97054/g.274549  ORF Transcript_97054/g.274549 Transcript_97054/m.274549 type:complete len:395 (+) Transcript_97054:529-1713(+)